MPNWCDNEVEIYCSSPEEREAVEMFIQGEVKETIFIEGKHVTQTVMTPFSFNAIIPLPNGEWDYDWCLDNWGCKWEPDITAFNVSEHEIHFHLQTPWCPPEGICDAIRDKFPEVTVNWFYREDGMEMAGWL